MAEGFPSFLKIFLKNFANLEVSEDVECFSMEVGTEAQLTFNILEPFILHIHCNYKNYKLIDNDSTSDTLLYFLKENSTENRTIAPLYWGISNEKTITCSGYLYFDIECIEKELLGIISILCSVNTQKNLQNILTRASYLESSHPLDESFVQI